MPPNKPNPPTPTPPKLRRRSGRGIFAFIRSPAMVGALLAAPRPRRAREFQSGKGGHRDGPRIGVS
jgi:hypothetical protein